ncbi:hypothetical protein NW768_004802 [Fusarium equiseti]|uniref:Zn(2)-C6 fungal-type domain-containing protein n=1 Tax=Fusarium equiseti TaxID=61235 RepID=A0ABQ8RH93_FUSEQ|nr:hypothetical protein NW768_004802 [Fusarium equiseti]
MPGGSRSRDGCFNCRKRKRRCDEEKPVCQRCRKNGVDCVFPTPASASNPLKFVVAGSNHYMIPITQSPSFLNLSPRELVAVTDYKQGGVWVQTPLPRNLSPFGFESIGIENALVQYYVQVISTSRVYVDTSRNGFRTSVIPRMFSGPLLSAVLSMSAAEWAQNGVPDGKDYRGLSMQYKVRALHELQQALLDSHGSEGNLLTCVLLASLEIAHGSCPTWLRHLQGALALLESFGDNIDSDVAEFVLQYFRFRYILMETTQPTHEDDSLSQAMTSLAKIEANLSNDRNFVDEQIGCSMDLVDIINEISSLSAHMPKDELYTKGQEIEQKIEQLSSQDTTDDYLSRSAESFQIAAQIYLRLVCYNTSITHPSIIELHESLLTCLSDIIFEGQTRRSFPMWPLFLAGCACSSDDQRKIVLDHFTLLDRKWPISNISAVWNALKLIWHTRDFQPSSTNQDWREVIHKFGWKLSLS